MGKNVLANVNIMGIDFSYSEGSQVSRALFNSMPELKAMVSTHKAVLAKQIRNASRLKDQSEGLIAGINLALNAFALRTGFDVIEDMVDAEEAIPDPKESKDADPAGK